MIAVPEGVLLPEDLSSTSASVEPNRVKLLPLAGKSALFSLSSLRIFNDSQVFGTGPVFVTTPPERWSFAAGFPVNEAVWRRMGPVTESECISNSKSKPAK